MTEIKEITINIDGLKLSALSTGAGNKLSIKHRILCLHGWLDNANSFKPLLSLIQNAELVAIDLPGHGQSEHQSSIYSLATQAHIALSIADALGWNNFSIIGHSLGGCIAPFATAAAPAQIEKLILIEAAGPRSETPELLPGRLAQFHNDMCQPEKYKSRLFDSVDQAIESRLRANKMSEASARLIIERQLKQVDYRGQVKWQWRFDSKLRIASPSYFTEEQVQSVLGTIACPTLCILADDGYLTDRRETEQRLNCIEKCSVVTLPGHHHLHLDTPAPVADVINKFLE